ncbi:MAG: apolipoprotein N-acyltransferase [Candidatus Omnitrophica bacterium CG1_02_44_16]|nr:MAG: apolipoprotein N-acyltransferase [Candidatus Omnitrophica bacterium CG1_02_44_16]PIY82351.1 MAG: apolipoprotein N-acyltransferase [Candidatus Omnitrophica bacterium CG_4_10_14_0_8_um_filter_44_12]PIZ84182.1 MAG: apolipoprotein N-acyltransferase [Candidatus Omnitrophica bacterium CG_4_10_14_0_2_um_filter_44_9]
MVVNVKILKNYYILAIVSAMLLRSSFPKFSLWQLAWVAFIPLFFALRSQKTSKAFLLSFLCGFLFNVFLVFWLINVTVPGMLIVAAYLALYIALFGAAYSYAAERMSFWQRLFFAPALWVLLEFARGMFLTGFPWSLLGYSQSYNIAAIQAADIFGAYGISFIVVFVNVFLFEVLIGFWQKKALRSFKLIVPLLIIFVWFAYGAYRVQQDPQRSCPLKVAVVQGNIPQEIKWVESFRPNIFKKYKLLTEIVHLKAEPDLIVWPETSFPDHLELGENDAPLRQFASQAGVPIMVGSIRIKGPRYFNSTLLFSTKGEVLGVYDKMHLVPFGEYIPARFFMPFIARIVPIEDFTPGRDFKLFAIASANGPVLKFATLICFEDILSDLASGFVRRGADFLVNMTNDAWFGDTSSPYQHMQASVLRAVENRAYVVRAANTGISCIIDDAGRVETSVINDKGKETFVTGSASGVIFKTGRKSFYTGVGDIFSVACGLYAALLMLILWRRPKLTKPFMSMFLVCISLAFCFALHAASPVYAAISQDQAKELSLRYYRGVVNFEAGRYDAAMAEFQSVGEVDPYYKDVGQYIEKCVGVLEQGRQDLYRAVDSQATDKKEFDLYFLGKSYYEKGEYRRAIEVFKAVLAKKPDDKFAKYYVKLCQDVLSGTQEAKKVRLSPDEEKAIHIGDLEKEVAYVKSDIKEQQGMENFLENKAQRKADRDELIRKKERQLKEQEELLGEEREDYLAQAKISKRTEKIKKESEKWKIMKERLASDQPGVPADLTEYPVYLNRADSYYVTMKESLRESRWNSAGLNAINVSLYYCDTLLIYFYSIKSAVPKHENIARLILDNVKRADTDANIYHIHAILNLKKIVESEDRPIARNEAIFLADHAEKLAEWCKAVLP